MRGRAAAVVVAIALSTTAAASAQNFRLGRWTGFAEVDYDWIDESVADQAGDRPLFERTRTEQKIGLRNRAVVIDRRVLVLHYGVTLGLVQNEFSSFSGTSSRQSTGDGRLAGYDLDARFFPQRRFSLDLLANRYESVVPQEFAGTVEIDTQNLGATFSMRRIFLPGKLSYRESEIQTSASSDPLVRGRDEVRRRLAYLAEKNYERHSIDLRYEHTELDDRLFANLDHRRNAASLRHYWELPDRTPGTLTSSVRYSDRNGTFGSSSFDWSETLRLRHRPHVSSLLRHELRRFDATLGRGPLSGALAAPAETTTETERTTFALQHQLYESLDTELRFETRNTSFSDGRSEAYEGRFDTNYRKTIPHGRLSLGFDTTYTDQDDRFDSQQAVVARERHTARFGEPFRLDRPNVIAASVVVTDEGGTTVFLEGVDYTLQAVGLFVELSPIPGGGIDDNTTVVVDYRIETAPRLEFDTLATHLRAEVDYGWIAPFFRLHRREDRLTAGFDIGQLDDLTVRTQGLRLRWRRAHWELTSHNELTKRESRRLDFDQRTFQQQLTVRPHRDWTVSVSANQQQTDFDLPLRETRLAYIRASLDWRPRSGVSIELFGSDRTWRDTLSEDEAFENAGIRARWRAGHLDLSASLGQWTRERAGDEFESLRATFRITRRFLPGGGTSSSPTRRYDGWLADELDEVYGDPENADGSAGETPSP